MTFIGNVRMFSKRFHCYDNEMLMKFNDSNIVIVENDFITYSHGDDENTYCNPQFTKSSWSLISEQNVVNALIFDKDTDDITIINHCINRVKYLIKDTNEYTVKNVEKMYSFKDGYMEMDIKDFIIKD
jgi:hypothetical protein